MEGEEGGVEPNGDTGLLLLLQMQTQQLKQRELGEGGMELSDDTRRLAAADAAAKAKGVGGNGTE